MDGKDEKVKETAIIPVDAKEVVALGLVHEFDYPATGGNYKVFSLGGEPLVRTENYSLAVAENPAGQLGIVMVAISPDSNGYVDAQARILQTLQHIADDMDGEAKPNADGKVQPPYYGAQFPKALDTFTTDDDRLGVFLGYHPAIKTYKQLIPLVVATGAERVDLQTGAWMFGKLMRLLDFVHSLGFTVGLMNDTNVFIEKDLHGVFVLDFTDMNEEPTEDEQRQEVVMGMKTVWAACGGSDTSNPPHDPDILSAEKYERLLAFMRQGINGELSAREIIDQAYPLFDELWPKEHKKDEYGEVTKRPWHEYRTYPR